MNMSEIGKENGVEDRNTEENLRQQLRDTQDELETLKEAYRELRHAYDQQKFLNDELETQIKDNENNEEKLRIQVQITVQWFFSFYNFRNPY